MTSFGYMLRKDLTRFLDTELRWQGEFDNNPSLYVSDVLELREKSGVTEVVYEIRDLGDSYDVYTDIYFYSGGLLDLIKELIFP